jgi:hypothetical protein
MQSPNIPILDLRLGEFYQRVGKCIKAWATIEDKLFDICEKLLKTDRAFVSVVFFRSPTIRSRIELTNELLRVRFPKVKENNQEKDHPVIVEWKPIKKAIVDLLPVRNSLAHDPVKMNINPQDLASALTQTFEASASDKEKLRGTERRVLDAELQPHLNEVDAISARLERFISGVLAQAQP